MTPAFALTLDVLAAAPMIRVLWLRLAVSVSMSCRAS